MARLLDRLQTLSQLLQYLQTNNQNKKLKIFFSIVQLSPKKRYLWIIKSTGFLKQFLINSFLLYNQTFMSKLLQENERLIPEPEHQQQYSSTPLAVFKCNKCNLSATDPVVSSCGHLFCWECLKHMTDPHNSEYFSCQICGDYDLFKNGRMIYSTNMKSSCQFRPKPQNRAPIRNRAGVTMDSSESYRLVSNVGGSKKLAGFSMMPPTFIQIFNQVEEHDEIVNDPEKEVSVISKCIKNSLFLMLALAVIGLLFNIVIL